MKLYRSLLAAAGAISAAVASVPAHAINIDPTLMGQWAEVNRGGSFRGLNLQYFKLGPELGTVFAIAFIFDNEGNQVWVAGNDPEVRPGDDRLEIDLSFITGGRSLGNAEDGTITNMPAGSLTMVMNNCNSATVTVDSDELGDATFEMDRGASIIGQGVGPERCAYQSSFTGCPAFATTPPQDAVGIPPRSCLLSGTITSNITLTNDTTWVLNGPVFIGNAAAPDNENSITIEPGTRIVGTGVVPREALIIARGAKIYAEGTPFAPIVFSSIRPTTVPNDPASAAGPGNWGGIVINGLAPVNDCPAGDCIGEGNSGNFGGNNPNDSSGVLRYVRIQFAGDDQTPSDQLNGLACQGCGSGTVIDYLQVHANRDDGIEFFGGNVNAKHLVLTDIGDDSIDWTFGWRGNLQYAVIRQDLDPNSAAGDNGIEADNNGGNDGGNNDLEPRSQPRIANLTLLGNPNRRGMRLRAGTGANITNTLVTGSATCIDIDDAATFTAAGSPDNLTGTLTIENSVVNCNTNFGEEGDDGFSVASWFNAQPGNSAANFMLDGIFPAADASFLRGMTLDSDTFGDFFDKVDYSGAFQSEGDAWTHGWTEFLE